MKVLLIRFSSVGDILLLNDAIKFLKAQGKNTEIFLLTKYIYKDIADIFGINCITLKKSNGFFDTIKNLKKLVDHINEKKIDAIFDFQNNIKSRLILFWVKVNNKFVFNKKTIKRRFMVLFKWFLNEKESIAERYLKLVAYAFKCHKENIQIDKKSINNKKIKTIVIHPGAKWKLKRWPYYSELIRLLRNLKDIKVILIGLKEEVEKKDDLLYIKGRNIINRIGQTDLKDLYKIIQKSDFFIGNDTMVSHMAAISNVPGIVLMGPTVKSFGFISEKKFFVIEKDIVCRPCHLHGGNNCPIETFNCMKDISPEYVYKYFFKILKKRF